VVPGKFLGVVRRLQIWWLRRGGSYSVAYKKKRDWLSWSQGVLCRARGNRKRPPQPPYHEGGRGAAIFISTRGKRGHSSLKSGGGHPFIEGGGDRKTSLALMERIEHSYAANFMTQATGCVVFRSRKGAVAPLALQIGGEEEGRRG